MHLFDWLISIDGLDSQGILFRQFQIPLSHFREELLGLIFKSSLIVLAFLVSLTGSKESDQRLNIDVNREVGHSLLNYFLIQAPDKVQVDSAAIALIRQARIGKTITQHPLACRKGWQDIFVQVLVAGGVVEEKLADWRQTCILGME